MSTVSESSVPKLEFDIFHSIYRKLYTTLTIRLMQDPKMALQIMAFWIWMEMSGFIDTVEKIYDLPLDLIYGLADEAIVCINFFKNARFPTPSELSNLIPLLHFLMKRELPLLFRLDNRASAIDGMKKVHSDICLKDLGDLYGEAMRIHESVKESLSKNQIDQLIESFNDNVILGDVNVGSNLHFSSSGLSGSGSGCIGFGLGSSSLLRGSSSSELGSFSVGLSESLNLGPGLPKPPSYNPANFGPDPIKVVRPGSLVSPHGYVGMGRGRSTSSNRGLRGSTTLNRELDAPIPITVRVRSKPNVGVIGQPLLARSNSFHQEISTRRMTPEPNLSSSRQLILNPAMRVGPSAQIQPMYVQRFPIPDTLVPAEQRTLFVTFSKGYRVNEPELRAFITHWFGNCIESVYMQETQGGEQPLYARIAFFSPETIEIILNGCEKNKFTINGKHVWVRKFIPKNQRTNSTSEP
ncbi:hypothetical protein QQ045_021524 [Rhodiola kirilowii]